MAKLERGTIQNPVKHAGLTADRASSGALPDKPGASSSSREPTKHPAKVVVPDLKLTSGF